MKNNKTKRQRANDKAKQMSRKSEFASLLMCYTHSPRTNYKKKKLSNRDAMCILFSINGSMTFRQVCDAMMTWRFGKATYKITRNDDYVRRLKCTPKCNLWKKRIKYRVVPKVSFNAYFNMGYGHCGSSAASQGIMTRTFSYKKQCDGKPYLKRHYWFRTNTQGVYAVTYDGVKRFGELKDLGFKFD